MAFIKPWRPFLLLSLLCATVDAITIHNNLTVVLENLMDGEDRAVSVPGVEQLILQCTQTVDETVMWAWSGGELTDKCFTRSNENRLLELNCVNQTYNGNYTCSSGNANYSVTLTIAQDLETLFVDEGLRYIGPNVSVSLPLGPRDKRGGREVVIPCVPVGASPNGSFSAKWKFGRTLSEVGLMVTSGPHPEDGAASVSLENVMGNMGTVENGVLRIGNLWPSVAGYYQCVLSNGSLEVANTTALLYYGPVFDRFSLKNASAIEGQTAELLCETFAYPVPEFGWDLCHNPGDLCYTCENPEPINFSNPKYDWWRPRPAGIALYGIQDVLQVFSVVYGSKDTDRGCYRCRIRHEGGSAEQLIFLRIRDDLAVLWPILGIILEFMIVAAFISGGVFFNRWKQSRKAAPTRSESGTSENRNLLAASIGTDKSTPVNADGPRKRPEHATTSV